jgi:hypothetical protein
MRPQIEQEYMLVHRESRDGPVNGLADDFIADDRILLVTIANNFIFKEYPVHG